MRALTAILLTLTAPAFAQRVPDASTLAPELFSGTVIWSVCQSGCLYPNPLEAWKAAQQIPIFGPFASLTIAVGDGDYDVTEQFYTDRPDTQAIQIVGNTADPDRVIFNYVNIVGNNGSGFIAERGGRIGSTNRPGLDGVTLNGVGARTNRTSWANQSYGAGALALGSGSNIYFGRHVVVQNFYYSALADQGGRFVGDGGTFRNAGDANLLARFAGVILCLSCTMITAAHQFVNAHNRLETLGRNALAEGSAALYVDGSNATDAEIACFSSHTNASVWAHDVLAQRCRKYGAEAQQGGFIEINHARLIQSAIGAYADTGGRMNVDGAETFNNTFDGLQVNGGFATGSALNAHDNGGFGVKMLNGGRGEFYATQRLLLRNNAGPVFVQPASGCQSPSVFCTPASGLIIN